MVVTVRLDLWLVRHGATAWTTARRFCGWSDPPLSEKGRAQARALRPRLEAYSFDSVLSSSSIRAVETARLAYGEPLRDERLRELDFGDIEGSTWPECAPELQQGLLDFERFAAPNGESVAQLAERVTQVLRELRPGRHLIVTHGGVVRLLTARSRGVPEPGGLTRVGVAIDALGGWRLDHRFGRIMDEGAARAAAVRHDRVEESPDSTGQGAGENPRRGDPRTVPQKTNRPAAAG